MAKDEKVIEIVSEIEILVKSEIDRLETNKMQRLAHIKLVEEEIKNIEAAIFELSHLLEIREEKNGDKK